MRQRVQSAIVMIVVSLTCVLLSPITRVLFLMLAGLISCYEYSRAVEKLNVYCCAWVMYLYICLSAFIAYFELGALVVSACFTLAVFLSLFSGILHRKVNGIGALYTLAGVAYPCFLFSLVMTVSVTDIWKQTLLMGVVSSLICDSFALFGGMAFGKHKVAPHVSPNKTIEGCISGSLFGTLSGIIFYFLFPYFGIHETLATCLITCFVASTFGQIGDLAESLMKRMIGVKDFSNLIPGHGGIFDRADALLFSIPTAYIIIYAAHLI